MRLGSVAFHSRTPGKKQIPVFRISRYVIRYLKASRDPDFIIHGIVPDRRQRRDPKADGFDASSFAVTAKRLWKRMKRSASLAPCTRRGDARA